MPIPYLSPMRPRSHYALVDEPAPGRDAGVQTTRDTKCSQYFLVLVKKTLDPIVKPFLTPRPWRGRGGGRGGRWGGGGHGAHDFRTNGRLRHQFEYAAPRFPLCSCLEFGGVCVPPLPHVVCQRTRTVSIGGIRSTAQRSQTAAIIRQTFQDSHWESRPPKRS